MPWSIEQAVLVAVKCATNRVNKSWDVFSVPLSRRTFGCLASCHVARGWGSGVTGARGSATAFACCKYKIRSYPSLSRTTTQLQSISASLSSLSLSSLIPPIVQDGTQDRDRLLLDVRPHQAIGTLIEPWWAHTAPHETPTER